MVFCSCHGAPKLCRWTRIRREVTAPLMIIGETRRNPRWILLATTTLQSMDEALLPSVPALHLHCMHMRSLSRLYGWGVLLPRGGRGDYGSGVRINKRLLLELPCRSAASRRRWRTPLGPAFLLFASLDRSEVLLLHAWCRGVAWERKEKDDSSCTPLYDCCIVVDGSAAGWCGAPD
jgi:hypothetical protein